MMRKRPPLPPNIWSYESFENGQEQSANLDEGEWTNIRKRGLDSLSLVRKLAGEGQTKPDRSLPVDAQTNTPGHSSQSVEEESVTRSEESPSLYSFWHDIGPTLSAILAVEEIGQQLLKLSDRSSVSSISDSDLEREIISKSFNSSLTPSQKNAVAHTSLKPEPNTSSFLLGEKAQDKWRQLNEERGEILGSYGGSRYLTWNQLISARAVTPSIVSDPPIETKGKIGARAKQKRRKMRIERVKAYYHKKLQTRS